MNIQKIMGLALGAGILFSLTTTQAAETAVSSSLSILKTATMAELPGKAAAVVAAADTKSQAKVTADVVKAAIGLNPAAAVNVVAAIASTTPEMASVAAATAASLLPQQAAVFAQTAASAAPKQAGKIAEAVCQVAPDSYRAVAVAVATAAPSAAREILEGIANAIPSLKGAIETALANYQNTIPSVNVVLAKSGLDALASGMAAGSPASVAPNRGVVNPIVPPAPVQTPVVPVTLPPVATGDRNYSTPSGHGP